MSTYSRNITTEVMEEEEPTAQRPRNKYDARNYLNIKLAKGENKKELRIRVLPVDKNTDSPFKTIYMHTIKVPKEISESGWKSYVCLAKTEDIDHETFGHKCPFCELNKTAYENKEKAKKEGNEVEEKRWKEISLANRYGEVCVMRVMQRGAEEDGPKFWKSNVRSDKKDPKNLIKELYRQRKQESIDEAMAENNGVLPEDFIPENILDLETGKDLKVIIERVFEKDGTPTDKTTVTVMDFGKNKPISSDPDLVDEWINDDKVWSDVFTVKPYDYLSIVIDGEIPFFDKENKVWKSKGRARDEEVKKKQQEEKDSQEKISEAEKKALEYEEDSEEPEDNEKPEDLPF